MKYTKYKSTSKMPEGHAGSLNVSRDLAPCLDDYCGT